MVKTLLLKRPAETLQIICSGVTELKERMFQNVVVDQADDPRVSTYIQVPKDGRSVEDSFDLADVRACAPRI